MNALFGNIPDFASEKAVRLQDDQVPVDGKLYSAAVYQFEKDFNVLQEKRVIRWTFWLAPGVPNGELRRMTQSTSSDPTYGDTEDVRLTDLHVPCAAGSKKLVCYCIDSTDVYVYGKTERAHICYNLGGVVLKNVQVLQDGKETLRQEYTIVDFHVAKP